MSTCVSYGRLLSTAYAKAVDSSKQFRIESLVLCTHVRASEHCDLFEVRFSSVRLYVCAFAKNICEPLCATEVFMEGGTAWRAQNKNFSNTTFSQEVSACLCVNLASWWTDEHCGNWCELMGLMGNEGG